MKLRTGRKVGRTIYVQEGDKPSEGDRLIGLLDEDFAKTVVDIFNGDAPDVWGPISRSLRAALTRISSMSSGYPLTGSQYVPVQGTDIDTVLRFFDGRSLEEEAMPSEAITSGFISAAMAMDDIEHALARMPDDADANYQDFFRSRSVETLLSQIKELQRKPPYGVPPISSIWHWEPTKPDASVEVEVVDTRWNGVEWWVASRPTLRWIEASPGFSTDVFVPVDGTLAWNSLDRWMEACVMVHVPGEGSDIPPLFVPPPSKPSTGVSVEVTGS